MKHSRLFLLAAMLAMVVGILGRMVRAQSSDQSLPTPVLSNEINGRIAALDLGDPRLTRHFYAFEGTPGDLLIKIDSSNLNGDMDIFTAVTFRPLMKTTLYANSQGGEVTKGLYLRKRQILILRVEARTPNDDAGAYHVRFGGSFAAFSGGIPVAENNGSQEDAARPGIAGKQLSSVGGTLAAPVVVEPTSTIGSERPKEGTEASKKSTSPESGRSIPRRSTPAARNSRGRTRPPRPKPAKSDTNAAKSKEAKTEAKSEAKTEAPEKEGVAAGEAKATAAGTEKSGAAAKTKAQEATLPGPHLVIESKDGTKIDRPMSTVRRVVVEGGVIVIVLKTGRIERIPMAGVARMAISEP